MAPFPNSFALDLGQRFAVNRRPAVEPGHRDGGVERQLIGRAQEGGHVFWLADQGRFAPTAGQNVFVTSLDFGTTRRDVPAPRR